MNLFRALSYKEWMKTRRLIGVMLLLMAAAVGYTYIDLTHAIRLNEAVNVWYGCIFQGTSVAPWMMYLLPLAGIALGVVQYVPEMTQKRLKLTLHLPAGETQIMASMLWYGFSVILLLCLLLSLVLSALVRLFLPSEIVGMMLQQLLPWMVAAVAGYGFTAWICIEPPSGNSGCYVLWYRWDCCPCCLFPPIPEPIHSSEQESAGYWQLLLSFHFHPASGSNMVYNKNNEQ